MSTWIQLEIVTNHTYTHVFFYIFKHSTHTHSYIHTPTELNPIAFTTNECNANQLIVVCASLRACVLVLAALCTAFTVTRHSASHPLLGRYFARALYGCASSSSSLFCEVNIITHFRVRIYLN